MSNAISLRDLEANFIRLHQQHGEGAPGGGTWWTTKAAEDGGDVTLTDAQGIDFLCPKCFHANGGRVGTHGVICWFVGRGVPDDVFPNPGRWVPSGTGIDDLTFIGPAAASVLLLGGGCAWHGFIRDGKATLS